MSTDLAATSKTRLVAALKSARGSLVNLRAAAEQTMSRLTIGVSAPVAGYANGYLHGWAERTGKKLTIGETEFTYSAAAGLVAVVAGAAGTKILGEGLANASLGIGAGVLASESSMLGYKSGVKPPT